MIDWPTVARNLRRCRPLAQIATEIDVPGERLQALARGEVQTLRDPVSMIRLLNRHLDLCPERHTAAHIGEP